MLPCNNTRKEMTEVKTLNMGEGAVGPLLLKMSLPATLAMIVMAFYNLIDTFWVSQIGPHAIAALTICFPIQMILAAIGVGTGMGAGSYASRSFGAGKDHRAQVTAGQVVLLSLVFGGAVILLVYLASTPLLRGFGATDVILDSARQYLLPVTLGAPFVLFSMMSGNLFRAQGSPNIPMTLMIIASVTNMILDPLMIFGYGPFPAMGIRGAALATVISQMLGCAIGVYFIFIRPSRYRLKPAYLKPDWPTLKGIYAVGLPSLVMQVVMSAVVALMNNILAGFGELAIAALGISFRINGVVMMMLFGFGAGVMPMVGFNYGARKIERQWQVTRTATVLASVSALFMVALIEIFARPLVSLFTDEPQLHEATVTALRITALGPAIAAPQIMWVNTFHGLGRGTIAMTLSLIRQLLLFVPFLLILPRYLGLEGVWWANPISAVFSFMVVYPTIYFRCRADLKRFGIRE
jgi:MATE family, multidrug efflux pump